MYLRVWFFEEEGCRVIVFSVQKRNVGVQGEKVSRNRGVICKVEKESG